MSTVTKKNARPTQDFVEVAEIRDGVLVLRDGSIRGVLMASSINFALKSQEEQDAIILQYQNFLNALDFSVQFFIQSRKLNIEPYLDTLRERQKSEYNDLLKIQITEYIEFVKAFVENANIVSKSFYVVVPFTPAVISKEEGVSGALGTLFKKKSAGPQALPEERFQEFRTQLYQRMDAVQQGLIRTGVRVVALNTEELIELLYGMYNPGEAEKGKLPEIQQ